MTRRRVEGRFAYNTVQPMPSMGCSDGTNGCDSGIIGLQPQIHFFQTAESYVALVQIWHEESWVWASAQVPRFQEVWERNNGDGLVLREVPRDLSEAMAQCARIASDKALSQLGEQNAEKSDSSAPSNNGRKAVHDWTAF
jgi:hypothetical protein